MAKIALRVYTREIEELIEHGQVDEAIAHCRHILETYPKHLATYRLLGKANLESKRYSDAADIFQRVLSSQPDDFVSNVGMSIIREDEGNPEAAIWHMERAFEVQPSNQAIQDELRRLYGRRDGVEPPKIRLTRGALSRMYAHGGLHDQAIAELRASLSADPQRPDLQTLLARMLFETGERVEAAEMATKLLEKLPFSLEANRLLGEILKDTERSGEAEAHLRRVEEMDPYSARTTPSAPMPDDVPDQAVTVEKLVWVPGRTAGTAGETDWAASLSREEKETSPEAAPLPDWLSGSADTEDAAPSEFSEAMPEGSMAEAEAQEDASAFDFEFPSEASATDEEAELLPPLEEPDQQSIEGPVWSMEEPSDEMPGMESTEDALAPADIPEWMLAMKPEDAEPSETLLEGLGGDMTQTPDEDIPDWLKEYAGEAQPMPGGGLGPDETPDWLKDFAELPDEEVELEATPEDTLEGVVEETPEEEVGEEPAFAAGEEPVAEAAVEIAEKPDWLTEMRASEMEPRLASPAEGEALGEESLDWLDTLGDEFQEEEGVPAGEEELPEWLQEFRTAAPEADEEGEEEEFAPEKAGEQPEAEFAMQGSQDVRDEETEDDLSWLDEFGEDEQPEAKPAQVDAGFAFEMQADQPEATAEAPEEPAQEEETPDWLKDIETEAEWGAQEAVPQAADSGDVPEWLQGLTDETEEAEAEESPAPEWLAQLTNEEQAGEEAEPASDWLPQSIDQIGRTMDEMPSAEPALVQPAPKEERNKPAARPKKSAPAAELESARELLSSNRVETAIQKYKKLVRSGRFLEEIIGDLKAALIRHPVDTEIWQTLGDAYMRADLLQEALDSYTKAENLIR